MSLPTGARKGGLVMSGIIDKVNQPDLEGKRAMHRLLEERRKGKPTFPQDSDSDTLDKEEMERVRRKAVPGEKVPWQED